MIYTIHYILFNVGLAAILILLTLFLQTYSSASLTEIGTLLMVLPFISILTKPLFCALADRQQAHRGYLMGSLALMGLGYGSLIVAPFFPAFIEAHGQLVWYLDVVGIVIGFSAFGVAWSLGDALAVNAARLNNVPWATYRVWATVAWGVGGCVVGQINELPFLPRYTPAFMLLALCLALEILCLAFWPASYFDMSGASPADALAGHAPAAKADSGAEEWRGTLSGSARLNPRLMGALANVMMEDLGESLRSSLAGRAPAKRAGLGELLEQHKLSGPVLPPSGFTPQLARASVAAKASSPAGLSTRTATFGKSALRRTQLALSRMNSLSSATGHAIADDLLFAEPEGTPPQSRHQMMVMSSLASNSSLSRAAAARAFQNAPASLKDSPSPGADGKALEEGAPVEEERKQEDLQIVLLKVIVKRDPNILKFLVLFVLMGILFTIHLLYFFMHVERLCREKGFEFAHVLGTLTIVHSISEVFCFMVLVPYYMPFVGRFGSMLTSLTIFAVRYGFYSSYYVHASPYWAIVTETGHGFAYGITYSLITEIAGECVDKVDDYLPELVERGIVDKAVHPNLLKLPLRATMYGVFSGAFDGLGNGIGALIAGIFLDAYSFVDLWALCFYGSLAIIGLYLASEWRLLLRCRGN